MKHHDKFFFQASDDDEGVNGQITYSILNYTDHFGISHNGSVYIRSEVDAEQLPAVIDIMIEAADGGIPTQTSDCILRVQIEDINDNRPQFTQLSTNQLTVPENTNLGQFLFSLFLFFC